MFLQAIGASLLISAFSHSAPVAQNALATSWDVKDNTVQVGYTTQIQPNYGGGYTSYGPGGTSTYTPTYGGGGVIYSPQGITTITPTYGGGFTSFGPGGTSTFTPTYGGGGVIYSH